MKEITIGEIEKAVFGELICGDRSETAKSVSTDSREATAGCIFFALKGDNHDAHDFIPAAAENGAKSFVVSKRMEMPQSGAFNVIKVDDTTKALQDLAKWYVSGLKIKKVGITGSTGKTTTKDMLYHICSEKYKTGKTAGNHNNHIGLPLTILSLEEDMEAAVLEMGAESIGEIHLLADIARPDIAVITNIGVSHIETFGSRENILKGKMEITDFFNEGNLLVANEGSDLLSRENIAGAYRTVMIGASGKSDYILSDITEKNNGGVQFTLEHRENAIRFELETPGRHNAVNAALAIAAAAELGISMEEAREGLKKVELTEKRLSIRGKNGIKVIDDTYNASPDSMRAAIDVLLSTKGMRKVAVLGDMLGLGENSGGYHEQIGEYIAGKDIGLLIAVGERAKDIAGKAADMMGDGKVICYASRSSLEQDIKALVSPGDVILVKGSRAMALENIVNKILE